VRHRQAVAVAAVALFGLAGCADRPNNLETYYDDPTPVKPTSTTSATPTPRAAPPPTTRMPDTAALLDGALLSPWDVKDEGVHPGTGQVSGCLAASGVATRTATWLYPSGSVLRQEVRAYSDRTGAEVVEDTECAGHPLPLEQQAGVTAQRAWCAGSTCTVLLAKGILVTTVSVAAATEVRAVDAAKRLLPIVAGKLAAQP
jgi:hypothetical protein